MSVCSLNDRKFKAIAAIVRPSCVKSSTSIVNWTLEFKLPRARSNFAFNLRSDRISRVTFKYILFSWNETWLETNRTARSLEGRRFPVFLVHHFHGKSAAWSCHGDRATFWKVFRINHNGLFKCLRAINASTKLDFRWRPFANSTLNPESLLFHGEDWNLQSCAIIVAILIPERKLRRCKHLRNRGRCENWNRSAL